jgi:hypothetical protein
MAVTLSLVLGATAGVLRLLDVLPGRLRQEPSGVSRVVSVADAERVMGARVWLPAYFPDTLRWPATAVTVHPGRPRAVTLAFADASGEVVLLLVESLSPSAAIPPPLPARGQLLYEGPVTIGDASATLSRFVGDDGRVWHDLVWSRDGRTLAMRARGPVEELVRVAASVRPRAGREP